MATVIHVDGLSNERMATFSVSPGETLGDALCRLGGTARFEEVPDKPRKVGQVVASFIAAQRREDPTAVFAIYWRRHSLGAARFDTAEEAERFLENGEDFDMLAGEAVVVGDQVTVWD